MNTKTQSTGQGTIQFEATVQLLLSSVVIVLPENESLKLSSRGQVSTTVTLNGREFQVVLEPDGRWSHWFRIDKAMQQATDAKVGDTVSVTIVSRKDWPEPTVPEDFASALADAPQNIQEMWHDITPMARWEWIRWVNATREPGTRQRRIEVSILKMQSGKRRPCCFNLAACTDPELSRSGRLIQSIV